MKTGKPKVGELVINRAIYEVHYAGQPLPLTPTEYGLLLALAQQAGA